MLTYVNKNLIKMKVIYLKYFLVYNLSPKDVKNCFIGNIKYLLPASESILLFMHYILKIYIASDLIFSSNICTEFSTISKRTINSCALLYMELNNLFYTSRPII